ncbi:MAG TPA: insulinase family protein [Sphingomonas sp.]|jgi:zinc protease|nr:insulinase family protein [Sphingomonas sp.]
MPFPFRAFGASLFLSFLAAGPIAGQQQAARAVAAEAPIAGLPGVDQSPWLYSDSDLVQDRDWKFGRLANGLRYAVRRNGVPPGQVAVRVRIDAGSLNENDSERGFAHFIEHLSFRGSLYVPDSQAKRIWQRFGATFGSDSNAQTTPTSTTYKLDLPSATEAGLDESMKILAGMMDQPTITDTTIGAERPVVLAEQREQPGPQVRFGDALRATFFAGQPLAERSPIGTVKTLEAATSASVRAFHDRWYRPERAVIIVAGDMDPAVFARLIVKNFGSWKGVGANPADPDFGKPDPSQPVSAISVEPGLPTMAAMAVLRPWKYNSDTVLFNQKRMVDVLATRLISRRLEQRARAGGSFLQASVSLDDVSRSANVTSVNIVPVGDDWQPALRDVRAVIADAMAVAPTQGEIDREYADYDTILRTSVETARVEAGAKQADDMGEALDIRETTTTPQVSYDILKDARAKGMFTPAALLASTRRIFEGDATRALLNLHAPDPTAASKLAVALKADVTGLAGKRRAQNAVTFAQLPKLGTPGTVTRQTTIPDFDMQRVEFANGVRALIFPNSSETGRVYVRVRFGGGYNALPANRPSPAWAGSLALTEGGIGTLDQGDLDQLVAGRRIGLDFGITEDAFSLGALTSPADLNDQLKLMAAQLIAPKWDAAPIARAKAVALAGYEGFAQSPDGVLSRDLEGLLHDGDPRWATPPRAQIAATTPKAFRALWQPLLASGPIEVSVFGNVDTPTAIDAIAKTFGALKPRVADTRISPIRFPAHVTAPVVRTHVGPDNQAAAVIAWPTGGGSEGIAESRRLDIVAQVFNDRLFDRLRSEAGASYTPSVSSDWPVGLRSGGRIVAVGQVEPAKVDLFFRLAREIAADLAVNPIGDDELKRTMLPYTQAIIRASSGNQFWLRELGGGTFDQRRIDATLALANDIRTITPAQLQAVAAKYLRPDKDWTLKVVPAARRGK